MLDEPTTGLDSTSAYDVLKSLRVLADAGIPVICSLLQPSQELLAKIWLGILVRRLPKMGEGSIRVCNRPTLVTFHFQ
jgi:ABC-type multidrug transport system ATPase subunit